MTGAHINNNVKTHHIFMDLREEDYGSIDIEKAAAPPERSINALSGYHDRRGVSCRLISFMCPQVFERQALYF
jgi:hypothetical protein